MTTAYTAFLDYVLPHVPGCTNEIALLAIRNTCIDFCEKSMILERDHDPVTIVAGIIDYDLGPPTGYRVVQVKKAWYKTTELTTPSPDEVGRPEIYNKLFKGADVSRSDPNRIIQKDETTFTVYPIPLETVPNSLTMRVALKPTRASSNIEDVIFEDYAEIIGYGALARLQLSPNKPYTNPQGAVAHLGLYQSGLNTARQRATRGHMRGDLQVQLRKI